VRNRVKRRLREAARELLGARRDAPPADRPASLELLIIARPAAATASYQELKRSLETAFTRGKLVV